MGGLIMDSYSKYRTMEGARSALENYNTPPEAAPPL